MSMRTLPYEKATADDIAPIERLCTQLIDAYEDPSRIDRARVLNWMHRKLSRDIGEYRVVRADGQTVGYFHFFQNKDGVYELDDLYILPPYQGRGFGTRVIEACCAAVDAPVMLYVFVKNERAVALYRRLGFAVVETVNETRYIMRREK